MCNLLVRFRTFRYTPLERPPGNLDSRPLGDRNFPESDPELHHDAARDRLDAA